MRPKELDVIRLDTTPLVEETADLTFIFIVDTKKFCDRLPCKKGKRHNSVISQVVAAITL